MQFTCGAEATKRLVSYSLKEFVLRSTILAWNRVSLVVKLVEILLEHLCVLMKFCSSKVTIKFLTT